MLTAIKSYALAIGASLLAVLYAIIKYQGSKIDDLKEENAAHVKLDEIDSTMEKAQAKAEEIEKKAKKDFDDKDWRNKI
jgi:Flp pilus assembly protein TadB